MKEILRLLPVARPQLPWMLAGIVLGILVIGANTALMAVSGWFITSMAVAGVTGTPFNYFFPAAAVRLFAILRTVGRYVERLVTHEASFRFLAELRLRLFLRLAPLAPGGLERIVGGEVAARLRSDIDALENVYLRIVAPFSVGMAATLGATLFVSAWSATLALALLGLLAAAGTALPLAGKLLSERPGKESARLEAELRTAVMEGVLGCEELALFGAAARQGDLVARLSGRLAAAQKRLAEIGALTGSGAPLCATGITVAFLLLGVPLVESGTLPGPSLVMLIFFALAAFEAVGPLASSLQLLPGIGESGRRILDLADAPPPVAETSSPAALPGTTGIVFRGVSCRYPGGTQALTGIDLDIPAGSVVAVTGPSGSGKSTLLEILLRFREFQGSITLGGRDIRTLPSDGLRSLISAVPQRPHLFNTTIRNNILLGNPDASAEELRRAMQDAGLEEWIGSLPSGLDTEVGEGGKAVSGGEARRIALARGLLKPAPILLLDEPTEGLDPETESFVVRRLAERCIGKTVLLVSHRAHPLSLASRVVAIGGGRLKAESDG